MKLTGITILFFSCTYLFQGFFPSKDILDKNTVLHQEKPAAQNTISVFSTRVFSPEVKSWSFVRNIVGKSYNDIKIPLTHKGYKFTESEESGQSTSYFFEHPNITYSHPVFVNTKEEYMVTAVFAEPNILPLPDKFTTTAQAINDKIKCCGKLKRHILFSPGGEVILSYNERFNFFYMEPFTGKEELVKIFKSTIKYKGSISVYENAANEYEVTFKISDEQNVVVSRFDKKEDALQLYKDLLLMKSLCKDY